MSVPYTPAIGQEPNGVTQVEPARPRAGIPIADPSPLCFVVPRAGYEPSDVLAAGPRGWVGTRPKAVIVGAELPRTRSGEIMRRQLKDSDPEIVRALEQEANRLR
jgi:acyl-coenzyme A synthetase/AMP-(fatty) acid ligase